MPASKIISLAELREALEEKFPEMAARPARSWETGWAKLDADGGAVKRGAVAELCSPAGGGRLFLGRMLAAVRQKREWAALVEFGRSFDPQSYAAAASKRMLCVFCENAEQVVKATDLLLRDGNLPLVLLDLQTAPPRSLGRIPTSTWHRFQRLVEMSGTALVVMTPRPMVEAARVRIALRGRWDLPAMRRRRRELIDDLEVQVFQRGRRGQPVAEALVHTA